jgi:hypothetical protein
MEEEDQEEQEQEEEKEDEEDKDKDEPDQIPEEFVFEAEVRGVDALPTALLADPQTLRNAGPAGVLWPLIR